MRKGHVLGIESTSPEIENLYYGKSREKLQHWQCLIVSLLSPSSVDSTFRSWRSGEMELQNNFL